MKATKEQIDKGKELAEKLKTDILFINEAGEYFTDENLAQLSVKGDKKEYQQLEYSTSAVTEENEELAEINSLNTVEDVQAILDLELEGSNREAIIDACKARIKELNKKIQR